jgi:hypothetical protein
MLKFDDDSKNAKVLAMYYGSRVGGDLLLAFVSGKADIASIEEAKLVIEGFWKMTDLAIQDNSDNKKIEGIDDIEFWMYKLFIKVNGYMTKNGFAEIWDAAANER